MANAGGKPFKNITIENNTFETWSNKGIYIFGGDQVKLSNNTFGKNVLIKGKKEVVLENTKTVE